MKLFLPLQGYLALCGLLYVDPLAAQQLPRFELLNKKQTGVTFKNTLTENSKSNVLAYEYFYNGGGVAIGDINNDGLDDIYLTANAKPNKLYLNQGGFSFKDITSSAGVEGNEGWKTGVTMADINGDGLLDIYVCFSGKGSPERRRNQCFINQGNLTFTDKAKEMGLDDPSHSTHATFFDYDKDGDLDMYLLNHNVTVIRQIEFDQVRNSRHPYAGDKLFRNDNGHFVDVSEAAGIKGSPLGFGLGTAIGDVNNDGWPDLYVSNDYTEPDYLYINQGNGTFVDQMTHYLQHISQFSMGCDMADINNDSWPDLFTLDMLPEDNKRQKLLYGPENYEEYALLVLNGFYHQNMRNMLHLNNQDGTFSEIGQLAGISNTDWSWAPLFADFDNDGWKDLFITNGYYRDYTNRDFLKYKGDYYFEKAVAREKADTFQLVNTMTSTPLHNYAFKNIQGNQFEDKSAEWGFGRLDFSNGAAFSDLDKDGDLDLVINAQNEEALLYRNRTREQSPVNNYIAIRLHGEGKNPFGVGAKVFVHIGKNIQYQEFYPVRGFQSSVSPVLHFGAGNSPSIDSVIVLWPGGKRSALGNVKANQAIDVHEGQSLKPVPQTKPQSRVWFNKIDPPLTYTHVEYGFNDFKRQPLLTHMLSNCGPAMALGDVNNDGRTDVYVGGAKENAGKMFIQNASGGFDENPLFPGQPDRYCTDADAVFLDIDGDGDQDLYVASGGYEDYEAHDRFLQDRLYLNDGTGHFSKVPQALPPMLISKSTVKPCDFDQDGDLDLFVGGRAIPGQFPLPPESYLLENNGKGSFTNVTSTKAPVLGSIGMVTDAQWADLNGDKRMDLIVVGDFLPIKVFNNTNTGLVDITDKLFDKPLSGRWNCLEAGDFDHDGDNDFIVGNMGMNTQLKARPREPLSLYFKDFDRNGSIDPILTYFVLGKAYPFVSRDELLDQMYSMRSKFTTYASYANAQLSDIFSKKELSDAQVLHAEEGETLYLENRKGKLIRHSLPIEAQFAPVYAILTMDVNKDGNLDFILGGNQSATRIRLGVMDANFGQLFLGNGKGDFQYVPQQESGLKFIGDIKSLQAFQGRYGKTLLVGINNNAVEAYILSEN